MALDGEIVNSTSPASLPSGDGQAGGTAVIQFTVEQCQVAADIDADCDNDSVDVDLFVEVLLGNDVDSQHFQRSDMDVSGGVDANDVPLFLSATVP